jgi:prenyltransferase beta subunit
VKKVLALINEIQIQDSCSSDEESVAVPPTKIAMVCKLAQIPPDIWMILPLEAKKWLLNETKYQKQEDDKMKKSLALSKYTGVSNDMDTNNSNLPNQYAAMKNVAKWEDVIKDDTDQIYAFVDEFLEEEMKSSSIYETDEDVDYQYWSSNHDAHATLSISNCLHNKCMNLLHLPEKYRISILDGGADTCVLG